MRLWYLVKTFSIFYVSEKWKKYLYAPIKELHLAREVGVLNEKRCKTRLLCSQFIFFILWFFKTL